MKDLFEILKKSLKVSAPLLIVIVVAAFFLKLFLEKSMEAGFKRAEQHSEEISRKAERQAAELAAKIENIGKSSLEIKRELRREERAELVALRVAIEQYEYFLQSSVTEMVAKDSAKADFGTLYEKDARLFQDVRIAIVRTGTYLRDQDLEKKLISAILKIRTAYYPLMNEAIPKMIDLQAQLQIIDKKLQAFQRSGMKDLAFAPTEDDRRERLRLDAMLTDETRKFAQSIVGQRRNVADQLAKLKEDINVYVYRPARATDIDNE